MRKVRFGILGCGHIGRRHAEAVASLRDQAELVAVADCLPDVARRLAAEHGCGHHEDADDLFGDGSIDVLCVCTPSGLHAQHAARALAARKHVVIEKPVALSLAAIDDLIALQHRVQRKVAVISQHRFDLASRIVWERARRGAFGRVALASAQVRWWRPQAYYEAALWRGTRTSDGGCLMNQAIHMIDLLRWIVGPVTEVHAFTGLVAHDRLEVEDTAVATLRFENGALGIVEATTAAYPGGLTRLEVHGDRGSAAIENDVLRYLHVAGDERKDSPGPRAAINQAQDALEAADWAATYSELAAHGAQLSDFVGAVREGREPLVGLREGRDAVAIAQAMYASGRVGRPVPVGAAVGASHAAAG